jgi:hypothetical protein
MFLTCISKNFDDGPVSFETFCWSYLRSVFCFQNRLPICGRFLDSSFRYFLAGRKGS